MADFAPPTATDPLLRTLAEAALAVLARDGEQEAGVLRWRTAFAGAAGGQVEIVCTGPDLPATIPDEVAPHQRIARERPWTGTYRLVVTAPLIVFDLMWVPDEPLRIMGLSRGDWEKDLLAR